MLTVLLGLLGLSIVVLIHELGHFLAARAVGVDVEAFSIGMGPRLAGVVRGGTEWRISAFPVGGYCRMKGEDSFRKALDLKLPHIPAEKGSFYGSAPWKRIIILVAGPLANVIFAVVLFGVVALAGLTISTAPNRIVLASEIATLSERARSGNVNSSSQAANPADLAGLKSGDRIISIGTQQVRDYADIQEIVGLSGGRSLEFSVLRSDERMTFVVTPRTDKETGQGLIGIYAWIDPLVSAVDPKGAAAIAGIRPGDLITSLNGEPIRSTIELSALLEARPERAVLGYIRNGEEKSARLVLSYEDGEPGMGLGLAFADIKRVERSESLPAAVAKGFSDAFETISMSLKGIGLLFTGVDVFKSLSGPAKITYLIGNTAEASIKASGLSGITTILSFLAFLSVSLFIMNLLPIPALDGGQIILSLVELVRRQPLLTKTIYRFQFVGAAMIFLLFFLATFSDILFFSGK
jgi:regulator of sigma E protease